MQVGEPAKNKKNVKITRRFWLLESCTGTVDGGDNERLRFNVRCLAVVVFKKQIPQRNEFVTNKETALDEKVGPVFLGICKNGNGSLRWSRLVTWIIVFWEIKYFNFVEDCLAREVIDF